VYELGHGAGNVGQALALTQADLAIAEEDAGAAQMGHGCLEADPCSQGRFLEDQAEHAARLERDRKSTRLNSSHVSISYAVFCLNAPTTVETYPLSLHDALPICLRTRPRCGQCRAGSRADPGRPRYC